MVEDIRLVMIAAVNEAVKYKNSSPYAGTEEVMSHIVKNISAKEDVKLAAIAAASLAINYKEKYPKARDKDVFQFVMDKSPEIIESTRPEKI